MKIRYIVALSLITVAGYLYTQGGSEYSGTIGGQTGGSYQYGQQGGSQYSGTVGSGGCPVCPVCPQQPTQPSRYISQPVTASYDNRRDFLEAVHRQDKAALDAWLKRGMDINATMGKDSQTPLSFAESNGLWDIAAYLRTQGATQ